MPVTNVRMQYSNWSDVTRTSTIYNRVFKVGVYKNYNNDDAWSQVSVAVTEPYKPDHRLGVRLGLSNPRSNSFTLMTVEELLELANGLLSVLDDPTFKLALKKQSIVLKMITHADQAVRQNIHDLVLEATDEDLQKFEDEQTPLRILDNSTGEIMDIPVPDKVVTKVKKKRAITGNPLKPPV